MSPAKGAERRETVPRREPVRTGKSVATYKRILRAAASVLAEEGYGEATLNRIAQRAEMKAGSLYYHFDSRDDLVEAVLREGLVRVLGDATAAVKALPDDATALDKLAAAITTHLECTYADDTGRAVIRTMGQLPPEARRRFDAEQAQYGRWWQKLLVEAQAEGYLPADADLTKLRLLIIGALNWTVEWPASARDSIPELIEVSRRFLLAGLVGTVVDTA